jgi:hypothetical protein
MSCAGGGGEGRAGHGARDKGERAETGRRANKETKKKKCARAGAGAAPLFSHLVDARESRELGDVEALHPGLEEGALGRGERELARGCRGGEKGRESLKGVRSAGRETVKKSARARGQKNGNKRVELGCPPFSMNTHR